MEANGGSETPRHYGDPEAENARMHSTQRQPAPPGCLKPEVLDGSWS